MYKNPLTKTYQYEYALYKTVADMFDSVVVKSRLIDSLKLYFAELPDTSKADFLREVNLLVQKDVIGHIDFPMMHICSAEVRTEVEKDGTHTFVFSDGIYRFSVHIDVPRKGHPRKITVNGHEDKKEGPKGPGASALAENRQK